MADTTINSDEELRARREESNAKHRLLTLPAELRNRIYTFALPDVYHDHHPYCVSKIGTHSNIIRVCRQIREEAMPIYYGQTQFGILCPCSKHDGAWFKALIDEAVPLLRHVCFMLPVFCDCEDQQHQTARGMHHLEIDIDREGSSLHSNITILCRIVCGGKASKKDATENAVAMRIREELLAVLDHERASNDPEHGWLRDDLIEVAKIIHAAWPKSCQ